MSAPSSQSSIPQLTSQIQPTLQVAEIFGTVKDVIKDKSINVITQSENIYTIDITNFFIPTHPGDKIYAKCKFSTNDTNIKNLILLENPLITISNNIEHIKECFMKSSKMFGHIKATKLTDHLLTQITITELPNFIDNLACNYNKKQNQVFLEPLKPICNEMTAMFLLRYWYKNRCLRQLYLFGLNNKEIRDSELNAIEIKNHCLNNPYQILSLSLEKCDSILLRQNKIASTEDKKAAQIIREVNEYSNQGHTCIPTWLVLKKWPDFTQYYPKLCSTYNLVGDKEAIYLRKNYEMEIFVTEFINKLIHTPKVDFGEVKFTDPKISDDQKNAVTKALNNNISVIQGIAGSGKTTIIKEIIYNLESNDIKFEVSSFTGKAVARLREVIGKNTPCTLDRLIMRYADHKFDYLIIDEISMVTTELIYRLKQTFTHDFKLILVGDYNQLEPIGIGCFYRQLLKAGLIDINQLTTNYRIINTTGDRNLIMVNTIGMINLEEGEIFEFETGDEFQVVNSNDIQMVKCILTILQNAGISADEITILTAFTKHLDRLNKIFQEIYNTTKVHTIDSRGRVLLLNDRVTHNYNNYDTNIMNGDTGLICEVDKKFIKVKFSDNSIHKFNTEIKNTNYEDEKGDDEPDVGSLDISFAMTTHKLQGSENKYIICYFPTDDWNKGFLNLNFLYTAFTRARLGIYIVGDKDQILEGIRTLPRIRNDKLSDRLKELNMKDKENETKI
jgi:exodeoxyribonuclease V alpha subunit